MLKLKPGPGWRQQAGRVSDRSQGRTTPTRDSERQQAAEFDAEHRQTRAEYSTECRANQPPAFVYIPGLVAFVSVVLVVDSVAHLLPATDVSREPTAAAHIYGHSATAAHECIFGRTRRCDLSTPAAANLNPTGRGSLVLYAQPAAESERSSPAANVSVQARAATATTNDPLSE